MTKISFRHRVEYWGFLILYTFIPHLSRRSLKRLADQVGIIFYLFASMRKRVARINLDIAFGNEKSDREKNRIILISFQNFLYVLLDGIWLSKNLSRDNWKEIIEVEGIDVINQATERGRGIICLVSHFGNWELPGIIGGFLDIPTPNYVARRQNNPLINQYIINFRSMTGSRVIYKEEAMTKVLAALRRNEAVGIVFDQNAIENLVFVDFFGVPAATTKAVAAFALLSKAAVIPTISYPLPDMGYKVVFRPELKYQSTGKLREDIPLFTQQCVHFIESYIKEQPQFYLWGHRRYKKRPKGEPKIY